MRQQATALREVDGIEIPAPGVWEIDAAHSSVGFVVRHLMIAKVRGQFELKEGSVTIGQTPEQTSVTATTDTFRPRAYERSPG